MKNRNVSSVFQFDPNVAIGNYMWYNVLMQLPKDPVMLLSAVNMLLRDRYPSLDELCSAEGADRAAIESSLATIGYRYDTVSNSFV